jgi:uncharacterized membrane protein YeaQ/YmgE (transglycosylase-associated protein family)
MHLSVENLVVILLVGIVAGWLAGRLVTGGGFGLVGDLMIGVLGAFLASLLFPALRVRLGTDDRSRCAAPALEAGGQGWLARALRPPLVGAVT